MAGIIVELVLNALLLWLFQKKGLGVLGLHPTRGRIAGFFLCFFLTAFCSASGFLMRIAYGESWVLNTQLSGAPVAGHLWRILSSVLYEELIYRGAVLYILMQRMGGRPALLISATAFGIYHWFSYGVLGHPGAMITTFLVTGAMGGLLAYAFVRSESLLLPVGIHLGWNLTQSFLFSASPGDQGLFLYAGTLYKVRVSYVTYVLISFLPLVSALGLNFFLLRRWRPVRKRM